MRGVVPEPDDRVVVVVLEAPSEAVARVQVRAGYESGRGVARILQHLGQRDVNELLVEAGPTLSGSLLQLGLVDELLLYQAPTVLGDEARGMLRLPGLQDLERRLRFDIIDSRQFGEDLRIRLRPRAS